MENQKVGLDAFNELAESHEAHVRQVKKLEEELEFYKAMDESNNAEISDRLDCEGISINEEKGKITISETHRDFIDGDLNVRYYNELTILSIIDWIQDTQSEMDLQTKTNDEILEEYYENRNTNS